VSLYDDIGEERIRAVIRSFYDKAFADMIIGHIFWPFDKEHLIMHQSAFAIAMLGGPKGYKGKALGAAHAPLRLRPAHFGRRQVLMRETLDEQGVGARERDKWLSLEEALRPLILGSEESCLAKGTPPLEPS
jgi:hemoglobin